MSTSVLRDKYISGGSGEVAEVSFGLKPSCCASPGGSEAIRDEEYITPLKARAAGNFKDICITKQ